MLKFILLSYCTYLVIRWIGPMKSVESCKFIVEIYAIVQIFERILGAEEIQIDV